MIRHSPADERLLAALARILRLVDPVPADVMAAAVALRVGPTAAATDPHECAGQRVFSRKFVTAHCLEGTHMSH